MGYHLTLDTSLGYSMKQSQTKTVPPKQSHLNSPKPKQIQTKTVPIQNNPEFKQSQTKTVPFLKQSQTNTWIL